MTNEVVKYDEKWAQAASRFVEKEKSNAQFISLKGGILSFDDIDAPGNQLCVVILHSIFENTFYDTRFNEDQYVPPVCYAMAEESEDLAPHPSMQDDPEFFQPQSEDCNSCPLNKYGTAETGKGKACSNRRRLALIPAGVFLPVRGSKGKDFDLEIFEDPEHYKEADMMFLKLPVMSSKEYSKFVKSVAAEFGRPPYGVLTRIYVEPDAKSQFRVKFEALEALPDDMFPVIDARHQVAVNDIITPYSPPEEMPTQKVAGRLKGARK